MASEPTVDVASNYDDTPQGPGDQSEGEIIDSEGDPADPADAGLPILDNLKMSEEEQRDYDAFSLASVSVPASSKRPCWAQGDSKDSQSHAQNVSIVRQARPQAVAKHSQLNRLSLIRDQSSFARSGTSLSTRLIFLSWYPKVKVKDKA